MSLNQTLYYKNIGLNQDGYSWIIFGKPYDHCVTGPGPMPGPEIWQDRDQDQGRDQKFDGIGTKDRD